ncbi:hypothetical protein EON64_06405 [archaeon]|nr:MAG: hypothetical protein EON64_06405 [archaeon]
MFLPFLTMFTIISMAQCRGWVRMGRSLLRSHSLHGTAAFNNATGSITDVMSSVNMRSYCASANHSDYSKFSSGSSSSNHHHAPFSSSTNAEDIPFAAISSPVSQSNALEKLLEKYRGKMMRVSVPRFPHCQIYLCGTLHVAHHSTEMVAEAIQTICPTFVMLELCEGRVDSLVDDLHHVEIRIKDILHAAWTERSVRTLAMGLLTWMQTKAAKLTSSKLGGEISTACKEASMCGSTIILGDRLYSVTFQRIFDRLQWHEQAKMLVILLWETLTMSVGMLADYIKKTHDDEKFIQEEIEKFAKYLPAFADVVIFERDEYLSQTINEIAKRGFSKGTKDGSILAVVGAGHLQGIEKQLLKGDVSAERMHAIASSTKQASTWPSNGALLVVDSKVLYKDSPSQ